MQVVAGMATHKQRWPAAIQAIKSLTPQVMSLFVYLNDVRLENVIPLRGQIPYYERVIWLYGPNTAGNLGDAGKFYPFVETLNVHPESDFVYLVCDDDNIYPPNYAVDMCLALERYDYKTVVGLHGKVINTPINSYHRDRSNMHWFHFRHDLNEDVVCNMLSTNAMAFRAGLLSGLTLDVFDTNSSDELFNQADLHFNDYCQRSGLPRVVLAHEAGYIGLNPQVSQRESIWVDSYAIDRQQTAYINSRKWDLLQP